MEKVILKSSTPIDYVMPFVDCSVKIVESFRDKRNPFNKQQTRLY
jgi:hypothetical protein